MVQGFRQKIAKPCGRQDCWYPVPSERLCFVQACATLTVEKSLKENGLGCFMNLIKLWSITQEYDRSGYYGDADAYMIRSGLCNRRIMIDGDMLIMLVKQALMSYMQPCAHVDAWDTWRLSLCPQASAALSCVVGYPALFHQESVAKRLGGSVMSYNSFALRCQKSINAWLCKHKLRKHDM